MVHRSNPSNVVVATKSSVEGQPTMSNTSWDSMVDEHANHTVLSSAKGGH